MRDNHLLHTHARMLIRAHVNQRNPSISGHLRNTPLRVTSRINFFPMDVVHSRD
jgi:hypothetical protein